MSRRIIGVCCIAACGHAAPPPPRVVDGTPTELRLDNKEPAWAVAQRQPHFHGFPQCPDRDRLSPELKAYIEDYLREHVKTCWHCDKPQSIDAVVWNEDDPALQKELHLKFGVREDVYCVNPARDGDKSVVTLRLERVLTP